MTTISAIELDEIMDRDPLQLSAQDIDKIIDYQRRRRAEYESGVKPKKEIGPKLSLDSVRASLIKAPAGEPLKRRI